MRIHLLFLDADELKMALGAQKASRHFEKRTSAFRTPLITVLCTKRLSCINIRLLVILLILLLQF